MKRFHLLWFGVFLLALGARQAQAQENLQSLRQEVESLKQTVNKLENLVQQQSTQIQALINAQKGASPSSAKEKESKEEVLTTQQAAEIDPQSLTSDDEVKNLVDKVESSPKTRDKKQFGLWQTPVSNSTAAKLIPNISAIATFAGAYFTQDPDGDTGHNPARTGFTFQELEVALQSAIDPYFRYDAFLAFSEEGVEIEEAYFTTQALPKGLQIRGGQMLPPFGRQNVKHLEQWSFVDNNLANQYLLGAEGLGELGLEIAYLFPTPFFLQAQGTFTNGSNDTSFGGTGKGDFLYQARLSGGTDITENLSLLAGASAAFGYNSTAMGNKTNIFGGDLLLRWKPSAYQSVTWQTEYLLRRMEVPSGLDEDGGLYSYVDVQFDKRWIAGIRYDQMGLPSSAVASEWRFSPALTYRPSEFSQIRAQYELSKTIGEGLNQAAMLQFQFSMGPHGAHPY